MWGRERESGLGTVGQSGRSLASPLPTPPVRGCRVTNCLKTPAVHKCRTQLSRLLLQWLLCQHLALIIGASRPLLLRLLTAKMFCESGWKKSSDFFRISAQFICARDFIVLFIPALVCAKSFRACQLLPLYICGALLIFFSYKMAINSLCSSWGFWSAVGLWVFVFRPPAEEWCVWVLFRRHGKSDLFVGFNVRMANYK